MWDTVVAARGEKRQAKAERFQTAEGGAMRLQLCWARMALVRAIKRQPWPKNLEDYKPMVSVGL
jgi:hypothetical protein